MILWGLSLMYIGCRRSKIFVREGEKRENRDNEIALLKLERNNVIPILYYSISMENKSLNNKNLLVLSIFTLQC